MKHQHPSPPRLRKIILRISLSISRTGGVQNRLQEQRITFDWLEELPGEWLHAEAVHTDTDGNPQSTAISIGPQHDTVGRQWIEAAAKEAVRRGPQI